MQSTDDVTKKCERLNLEMEEVTRHHSGEGEGEREREIALSQLGKLSGHLADILSKKIRE